jgi:hypothetical protein
VFRSFLEAQPLGGEVSPPAPQETRLGDKPQSGFLFEAQGAVGAGVVFFVGGDGFFVIFARGLSRSRRSCSRLGRGPPALPVFSTNRVRCRRSKQAAAMAVWGAASMQASL